MSLFCRCGYFLSSLFPWKTRKFFTFQANFADFSTTLIRENFPPPRVFNTPCIQGKFSYGITLFSDPYGLVRIFPQTFPQPVENFFQPFEDFVILVRFLPDNLWHFSDKSMTIFGFHFVIPTKCSTKCSFFRIFTKVSRKISSFWVFPMSFPQSVGKPVGNSIRQISKSPWQAWKFGNSPLFLSV